MPAGEKASAGHLTYNVVDSQICRNWEMRPIPAFPKDRFVLVQIAVTQQQ